MNNANSHTSVLLPETIALLDPKPHESLLDVTLGLGGHAKAVLERTGPDGILIGIDDDQDNISIARERLAVFGDRVLLLHANFGHLGTMRLAAQDMILADLGLSSPHIDLPERGFTFRSDAPLDMRYDRTSGESASAFLERVDIGELTTILSRYGEIRFAGALARAIKRLRPQTTFGLSKAVEEIFTYRTTKVLPQVFQAVRMAVNREVEALESFLAVAPHLLQPGGRLVVISYHSIEDRLVKHAFRALATPVLDPTTGAIAKEAPFTELTRKCIVPSPVEIGNNPRSRSAKLRAIQKSSEI